MHIRHILSASLLVLAGSAVAADGGTWDYYVRVQASAGLLGLSGDASYKDGALSATGFDMGDLGLDDAEITPAIEIGLGTPLFDFDAHLGWQSWSTEGSKNLSKNINFGGTTFGVGTPVSTKASIDDLYIEGNWSPVALNLAGVSLGLALHRLNVTTEVAAGGTTEKLDESAILPTLALRAYAAPLDSVEAEVMLHALSVPLGDVSGSYVHAQLQVAYYPVNNLGIIAGWRHTMIDIEIEDGAMKADANVALSGPFLGVAAQF